MSLNLEKLKLKDVEIEFLKSSDGFDYICIEEDQNVTEVVQEILNNQEQERCFGVIFSDDNAIGVVKGHKQTLVTPKVNAIDTLRDVVVELDVEKILILEKDESRKYRYIYV